MTGSTRADASALLERLGGRRGVVDGGLPAVVFLVTNALSRMAGAQSHALSVAAVGALGTGSAVVALRIAQGAPRRAALGGVVGVVVAVAFAVWSGDARDYFLPGIWVDALYGAVFALSVLLGRPVVGYVYAALFGHGRGWRRHRALRRAMAWATWGWAGVFVLRAATQLMLYEADQPELLGLAKLMLGWPLTVVAVVLTLRAARSAQSSRCHS